MCNDWGDSHPRGVYNESTYIHVPCNVYARPFLFRFVEAVMALGVVGLRTMSFVCLSSVVSRTFNYVFNSIIIEGPS